MCQEQRSMIRRDTQFLMPLSAHLTQSCIFSPQSQVDWKLVHLQNSYQTLLFTKAHNCLLFTKASIPFADVLFSGIQELTCSCDQIIPHLFRKKLKIRHLTMNECSSIIPASVLPKTSGPKTLMNNKCFYVEAVWLSAYLESSTRFTALACTTVRPLP